MLYQSARIGILYVYPIIASCRTVLRHQPHPHQQHQQHQHQHQHHQTNIPESSGNSTPHRHQTQANNNDDPHDLEHWSLYWLISSLLTLLLERPVDALLLSWVPCYRWIKLLFYLWLALPRFQGAARLYYLIVHPWFTRHEVEIDAARGKAWEAAKEGGRKLAVAAVSVATAAVAAAGEEGVEGRAGGRGGGGGLAALGGVSGLGGVRFVVSEAARVVLASVGARAGAGEGGGGAAPAGGGGAAAAAVPQANNRQRKRRARHGANRQEMDDGDERFERRVGNSSGEH